MAMLQSRHILPKPSRPKTISKKLRLSPLFARVQLFLGEDTGRYDQVSSLQREMIGGESLYIVGIIAGGTHRTAV